MKPKTLRRIYLSEATLTLFAARLAVRFLSPSIVLSWARRPPRRMQRFGDDKVEWVTWAVETVSAKPWMNALCLPRAVAAQSMLRRRGVASRLCLGVAREGQGLVAHAWIEIGQDIIVGGAGAAGFTRLAEFGRERP